MSIHSFRSLQNAPPPQPTAEEMAVGLALEMIERIKERRTEAKHAEIACEESVPWNELDQEAWDTLEALIGSPAKPGRHRLAVLRLLFTHFPELIAKMKVN